MAQKFYGVKVGLKPGVYYNWTDCQNNVIGYPGSKFQSFKTEDEAYFYVYGSHIDSSKQKESVPVKNIKLSGSKAKKFYGVKEGVKPGVYDNWNDCKANVDGYSGAKYKSFKTEEEAIIYVYGVNLAKSKDKDVAKKDKISVKKEQKEQKKESKQAKREIEEIENKEISKIDLNVDSDVSDKLINIEASKEPIKSSISDSEIFDFDDYQNKRKEIYAFVDGSFNIDTQTYGYGGFLYVDGNRYPLQGCDNDPEMASMRNVAGEICGAMAAVNKAKELGIHSLTIYYDYTGIENWVTGAWKTKKIGTAKYALFMRECNLDINFEHVKGHSGIEGNETADVMAKQAVGIELTPQQQELLSNLNARKD